jgi:monothiol glutaredoxin
MESSSRPARVEQISALDLKAWLDKRDPPLLIDVRTPGERDLARIEGARLLDQPLHDHLLTLDRATPLVFQCHHGMRSQAAAQYFVKLGFQRVYNLIGGIEAWSQDVDPTVPRY